MRHFLFFCAALCLGAQQSAITNASVVTATAANGLAAAIRTAAGKQSTAAWIGYAVAKIPGDQQSCCWNSDGKRDSYGCGLEGRPAETLPAPAGPVKLEGPAHVAILLRVEQGAVMKIRSLSIDCPLDGGGVPFHWLTNVRLADSVTVLAEYVRSEEAVADRRRRVSEPAVHALAMHAGSEAALALEQFALTGPSLEIRKPAAFWLASSRGKRGTEIVRRLLRDDANEKVREHAIFALTRSSEPDAIPAILRAAKEDRVPRVRGQALFWLAQRISIQAIGPIRDAIAADPDLEVKKKAVFALAQMANGNGIPALILVARDDPHPVVRRQAMHWLGRSKDPRAVEFFAQVLAK